MTLGTIQIPWIKRHLRTWANLAIALLLKLRSQDYAIADTSIALVVAPHQDDETLGCGGLILRKRLEGQPVHVVYVTDGSASHSNHPTITCPEIAGIRAEEGRAAGRILGVETSAIHFLGAIDGTLEHLSRETRALLVDDLRHLLIVIRPDEVFIPYRRDGSSEHEAAFDLCIESLAGSGLHPRVFEYLVWSWWNPLRLLRPLLTARQIWRYRFHGYEGIKIAALQCYRSQFEPALPWKTPVVSPAFLRLFQRPDEFYFEI
jgi:LmbE family N-acetylglucosaminyl deacetylase